MYLEVWELSEFIYFFYCKELNLTKNNNNKTPIVIFLISVVFFILEWLSHSVLKSKLQATLIFCIQ